MSKYTDKKELSEDSANKLMIFLNDDNNFNPFLNVKEILESLLNVVPYRKMINLNSSRESRHELFNTEKQLKMLV